MADRPFFSSMFDFTFTAFITTRVIKLIFGLAIFFSGLLALMLVVSAFQTHASFGVLVLLVSPLLFLFYVAAARVALELVIVIFRIHEDIARMAPPAAEGPPPPAADPTAGEV
jgi:hypothetical protein